jgi:HD-GYP domain-containing protein (c-di-GMP phosphodiesterase class II)
MSWDRRSAAPSSDPKAENGEIAGSDAHGRAGGAAVSVATLVKARGVALLDALELHLPGARDHADGTASYAFAAAAELGLDRERAEAVRETARLHEVGKVYVPTGALRGDPSALDANEHSVADTHPGRGAELARGAGVPEEACKWIAATAERFDGGGPGGFGGEDIPVEARIIRVACACDAGLSTLLPPGWTEGPAAVAIERLRAATGTELDPRVVEALVGVLNRAAAT